MLEMRLPFCIRVTTTGHVQVRRAQNRSHDSRLLFLTMRGARRSHNTVARTADRHPRSAGLSVRLARDRSTNCTAPVGAPSTTVAARCSCAAAKAAAAATSTGPEGGRRQRPSGQVRPLGAGHAGANKRRNVRQAELRLEAYVASTCCSSAHKRLNALLSAGSLSTSVNTAQTASRSSSLRTFVEPVLPSTAASLIDAAMLAEPFCLSLSASSSTCCGTRRTKERSRHRTVSKLSALAFIRVLVSAEGFATVPRVVARGRG
jgi:hypothetical protein